MGASSFPGVEMFRRFLRHRMALWLFVSLILVALIGLFAPQLLPVSLYKLSLITSAAWLGYWIDRSLFPYARPDIYLVTPWSMGAPMAPLAGARGVQPGMELVYAVAMLRRATIIAAAMIGVALGA